MVSPCEVVSHTHPRKYPDSAPEGDHKGIMVLGMAMFGVKCTCLP